MKRRRLLSFALMLTSLPLTAVADSVAETAEADSSTETPAVAPGELVDYAPFYPDRWKAAGVSTRMVPWRGERVVLLTTGPDFDPAVMGGLLQKLDAGWAHYANLTGRKPRPSRLAGGLPTLAAVPDSRLTCGYGCGYVGATGIELSAFYARDYRNIANNPRAIPDYYFYEMGRNYFTFGDRHNCFTTGFAVFMRYVCMDHLRLDSRDSTRQAIEAAIGLYEESDKPFLQTFTNLGGLSEKQPRLQDARGRTIGLSDQPVMYASAMLKLRSAFATEKDPSGDQFVERFFRHLATCPGFRPTGQEAATRQCLNWLVAASCAAGEDLSPVFADQWRMPVSPKGREAMRRVDWEAPDINAGAVVKRLMAL